MIIKQQYWTWHSVGFHIIQPISALVTYYTTFLLVITYYYYYWKLSITTRVSRLSTSVVVRM